MIQSNCPTVNHNKNFRLDIFPGIFLTVRQLLVIDLCLWHVLLSVKWILHIFKWYFLNTVLVSSWWKKNLKHESYVIDLLIETNCWRWQKVFIDQSYYSCKITIYWGLKTSVTLIFFFSTKKYWRSYVVWQIFFSIKQT